MSHPTEATLRRLLEEPAGVTDADRAHVADCSTCLAALGAVQAESAFVSTALVRADTDTVGRGTGRRKVAGVAGRRWRAGLRSPVAAAAGVAVLVGGASAAAAADWFDTFRTEQIAPVALTQADVVDLPDLSEYGTVRWVEEPDVRDVAGAAAAEEATGMSVPQLAALPDGIVDDPMYRVGDQVRAVFTFSAEEAAAAGEAPPPRDLDGSRFELAAGPGIAVVWPSEQGLPGLVVARAVAPTVDSSGIPFERARDYLLSLPGIPADVEAQLRSLTADGSTLPVPVPAEQVATSTAEIHGVPATVFEMRDGTVTGVVWVDDGLVTAVAGSLSYDEVLSVARGLREQ